MIESGRTLGARYQRGWVGMLALLLALVLMGFLARTLLQQMGVTARAETPVTTRSPASKAAASERPSTDIEPLPGGGAMPGAALERARAFDAQVQQQSRDAAARIDAATK